MENLIVLVTSLVALVSFVAILYPIRKLWLPTRERALGVFVLSLGLMVANLPPIPPPSILEIEKKSAAAAQLEIEKKSAAAAQLEIEKKSAAAAQAETEAAHARQDRACRQNARCWAMKHFDKVIPFCLYRIERRAKYDYEWTNGFFEPKFDSFTWKDRQVGIVRYRGDSIKFQNGFGAWQRLSYACDYNSTTGAISVQLFR